MQEEVLLSITIPTWNRADLLNSALSYLLPQFLPYTGIIELIVSDNGSTDDTKDVISKYIREYPAIKIISFTQPRNIGHSSNVRKCRELSKGKFLWVLSDDEFILDGVIAKIINYLINNQDIGGIFVNGWSDEVELTFSNRYQIGDVVSRYTSNMTLISANIIYNDKSNDNYIYSNYDKSVWLGLLLTLNVYSFRSEMVVLNGKSFIGKNGSAREIDWFKAFITDLDRVYKFMSYMRYTPSTIRNLRKAILKNHIRKEYVSYKMFNIKRGTMIYWKIGKINKELIVNFYDMIWFWFFMLPLILFPKILFSEQIYGHLKNIYVWFRRKARKLKGITVRYNP